MRFGEPLPRTWRYVLIVVGVLLLAGIGDLGESLAVGGILIAIAVRVAVGIVARVLYRRSRQ
jgi:hypothetical protein